MHVENFTKGQVGHIFTHNENERVRGKRENVDKKLTHLNYNLCERKEGAKAYWQARYDETTHSNQKKTAVMSSIILSAPDELKNEEQKKQFFEESYSFLKERYGEKNVVSAWVHRDEPDAHEHLHFCIVPVNSEGRCSARGVFSRTELKNLHKDLQKHLDEALEFEAHVMNGATSNGAKSIAQLKAETLEQRNKELESQIAQMKALQEQSERIAQHDRIQRAFKAEKERREELAKHEEAIAKQEAELDFKQRQNTFLERENQELQEKNVALSRQSTELIGKVNKCAREAKADLDAYVSHMMRAIEEGDDEAFKEAKRYENKMVAEEDYVDKVIQATNNNKNKEDEGGMEL